MIISGEDIVAVRRKAEREFYLADGNFLDYIRDFGIARDCEFEPHGRYAPEVLDWTRGTKKMVLWPRGSFKSTIFDSGYSTREIDRDPNIRILIWSETYKQAANHAGVVKEALESKRHIEVFGVHEGAHWTTSGFTTCQRTKNLKEPTVTISGVEQVQTGMHFDLVIADDIVSQENTRTPEAIQALRQQFSEMLAQLDPGARLLLIGTRHHFFDLYGSILKDPELRALFDISIHSYLNPDGSLFFPKRLTHEYVSTQKILMKKTHLWSAFYLNRPQSEEDQMFKVDQFHTINDHEIPLNCWVTVLTDFASGENKRDDRTAILAVAIDVHRTCYVLEARVGRWLPKRAIREALELYAKYVHRFAKGITMEKTTHVEWAKAILEEERRALGIRPPIIEIGGRSQETKVQRIQAMQGRFNEGGRIWWAESIRVNDQNLWELIVTEITEFPFSQHDDIPDALSDIEKQRDNGGYYVAAPPPGFNPARTGGRFKPTLRDGSYNPEKVHELDLGQLLRHHTAGTNEDLWKRDDGSQRRSAESTSRPGTWP